MAMSCQRVSDKAADASAVRPVGELLNDRSIYLLKTEASFRFGHRF